MAKNPHAKADGSPKAGELIAFVEWEEAEHQKKLDAMDPQERKAQIKAEKHLSQKMNS